MPRASASPIPADGQAGEAAPAGDLPPELAQALERASAGSGERDVRFVARDVSPGPPRMAEQTPSACTGTHKPPRAGQLPDKALRLLLTQEHGEPSLASGGGAGGPVRRAPAGPFHNHTGGTRVSAVSMRELLEAGVHFGHQTRRWNPKMRRFIFTERGGIYIIDLQQTLKLVDQAHAYARNIAERGGAVLFVGTKKQCQDSIAEHAARVNMPYVNHRWLGGLLTNYRTMQGRIGRLHELRRLRTEGQLELLPTKERMSILRELEKLETNLGGVAA